MCVHVQHLFSMLVSTVWASRGCKLRPFSNSRPAARWRLPQLPSPENMSQGEDRHEICSQGVLGEGRAGVYNVVLDMFQVKCFRGHGATFRPCLVGFDAVSERRSVKTRVIQVCLDNCLEGTSAGIQACKYSVSRV